MALVPHYPKGVRPAAMPQRRKKPRLPGQITATTPGWEPDWQSLINSDYGYQNTLGKNLAASASDKATRNAGLIQGLINFGGLPNLAGVDLGDFNIDPSVRAAIEANTSAGLSQTAELQRQHNKDVQDLQDVLAARGILRSGALGVGLGQEQTRYAGAQEDARQKLLALLGQLQGSFSAAEGGRASDLAAAASDAFDRAYKNPANRGRRGGSIKAHRDPASGLYVDANGNYYDRHGNHVSSPSDNAFRRSARYRPSVPYAPSPPVYHGPGGYQP